MSADLRTRIAELLDAGVPVEDVPARLIRAARAADIRSWALAHVGEEAESVARIRAYQVERAAQRAAQRASEQERAA